jgi:hypothetical protein
MEHRDNEQTPSTQPTDETASNQTEGFKQPESGSDQDLGTAGETTTLGQQQTDIEGTEPTDGSVIGKQGQADTSSELVEDNEIDKDGQPPHDGE